MKISQWCLIVKPFDHMNVNIFFWWLRVTIYHYKYSLDHLFSYGQTNILNNSYFSFATWWCSCAFSVYIWGNKETHFTPVLASSIPASQTHLTDWNKFLFNAFVKWCYLNFSQSFSSHLRRLQQRDGFQAFRRSQRNEFCSSFSPNGSPR